MASSRASPTRSCSRCLSAGPPPSRAWSSSPCPQPRSTGQRRSADAARASHYASTRGESDYARLTAEVAAALNKIAAAPDDRTRLQMAETMRRRVADWARESYGYRTFDISQISGMLDELVSSPRRERATTIRAQSRGDGRPAALRAAPAAAVLSGQHSTGSDGGESCHRLRGTDVAARSDRPCARGTGPGAGSVAARMRAHVESELSVERQLDARYAAIARRSLLRADERSSFADVRGVQTVITQAMKEDDRPGGSARVRWRRCSRRSIHDSRRHGASAWPAIAGSNARMSIVSIAALCARRWLQ